MFTCSFFYQCIKDEKLAREKYLDNSKGIKHIFKKLIWTMKYKPKWQRNSNYCHQGCHRWNEYHMKHFSKSLTPEVLKKLDEIDKNTTHDKYYI